MFWNPPRELLPYPIPFLGRPILWYGFFFASGFLLGYALFHRLLRLRFSERVGKEIAERSLIYSIVGVVLGARIGDLLFYQGIQALARDPLTIFRPWDGGLASHGGVVGLLIALALVHRKEKKRVGKLSFPGFLDFVCLPAAVIAGFIRIGNFFNQEILGTVTTMPWGVVFGRPADGSFPVSRHPVQLYEALFYFFLALLLAVFGNKLFKKGEGITVGWFLLTLFGFRFLIEYCKTEQTAYVHHLPLNVGQILTIPFLFTGLFFLFTRRKKT